MLDISTDQQKSKVISHQAIVTWPNFVAITGYAETETGQYTTTASIS